MIPFTETALSSLKQPHTDGPPPVPSPHQRRDSDRYCQLCAAWFNNPMMAQQHYDGKKHKKNAARADLLEQLGKTLDLGELRGESTSMRRPGTCCLWGLVTTGMMPCPLWSLFLWSSGAGETMVLRLLSEVPVTVKKSPPLR